MAKAKKIKRLLYLELFLGVVLVAFVLILIYVIR